MADAREARRQRILKRGAERLAFITGDRNSLDRVVASEVRRSDQSSSNAGEIQPDRVPQQEIVAEEAGNRGGSEREIEEPGERISELDERIKRQIKLVSADEQPVVVATNRPSIFTLQAFQASLDASRGVRALLSLLVALQVVLFSSLGSKFTFAAGHPTLLLFISSASVVLLFMFLGSSGDSDKATIGTTHEPPSGLDRALGLLQALLTARSAASAIALDFSIFIVAIVCLLPLLARFPS